MKLEKKYSAKVGHKHLKAMGQFFTPAKVAEFMCRWAGKNAKTMLDPAAGNSVFLRQMSKLYPKCHLTGYELDEEILHFFGSPARAAMIVGDYLVMDWQQKYEAIVCNPPYNKFQAVGNRVDIFKRIYEETGCRYNGSSNLYTLFLVKSIYQLAPSGRLAYIIPSEFLNSVYGIQLKELLLRERLLRSIINFQNNEEIFPGANTTCCIILLDRKPKEDICFYNLASMDELLEVDVDKGAGAHGIKVRYEDLRADEKWRPYLYQENQRPLVNLVPVGKYCRISRGIATGANDFFCFSRQEAKNMHIDTEHLRPCLCRAKDVQGAIWRQEDWQALAAAQAKVYVLDIQGEISREVSAYIRQGEAAGLAKRYLLSKRQPWYSMEQKPVAPILISSAYRGEYKVLRNLARSANLTAFHGVYMREGYERYVDIIFCYLLTDTAREIIDRNRKELGRGLKKLQPGDLQEAEMLDIELLRQEDCDRILTIYDKLLLGRSASEQAALAEELEKIFQPYYYNG